MFPHFKKYTIMDESQSSITSSNTNTDGKELSAKELYNRYCEEITLAYEANGKGRVVHRNITLLLIMMAIVWAIFH